MFHIDYVTPEKAQGAVAETYGIFPPQMGVPEAIQVMSASPELLSCQGEVIKYFMGKQEELSFHLLAAIRFVAATHYCHEYCTTLNRSILKSAGMTDEELDRLTAEPTAGFEEAEAAMLAYVIKSLDAPESVNVADTDGLREHGWSDRAIFDAVAQAAHMSSASLLFRTFKK